MIEIKRKKLVFNKKEIWFADYPFDIVGFDCVTFYDCKNITKDKDFSCDKFKTLIIDLRKNLEDIWNNMDKSSCRYMINRAEKEGIKIIIDNNYFEEFKKINDNFRKLKGLPPMRGIEDYKNFGILFIAEYKGERIAGQFYIFDEKNFRWFAGASKRLECSKEKATIIGCANRLMIWEAIKYSRKMGFEEFDFGGYIDGEGDEKIKNFKKSFGGKNVTHYVCHKKYSKFYIILSYIKQNLLKR